VCLHFFKTAFLKKTIALRGVESAVDSLFKGTGRKTMEKREKKGNTAPSGEGWGKYRLQRRGPSLWENGMGEGGGKPSFKNSTLRSGRGGKGEFKQKKEHRRKVRS